MKWLPHHLQHDQQDGVTIISVIVAVVVLGIAVVAASQGMSGLMFSRKSAAATVAVRDAQDSIVQVLVGGYKSYIAAGCSQSPANKALVTNLSTGNAALLTFSNAINVPPVPGSSEAADLARCRKTKYGKPNYGAMYGCYQITVPQDKVDKADNAAFAANRGAFIETYVTIRDFRTDGVVKCSSIPTGVMAGHGIEMYYSIHWVVNTTRGLLYKTRIGSVDVNY